MRKIRIAASLLLVCALIAPAALSQAASGSLSGTVADPSGGAVPGAEIRVVNQATGREVTAISSDIGSFSVPNLLPGLYEVRVTMDGFKTFVARDLKVNVGEDYSLTARLELGDLSEEVQVIAGADLIKTTENQITTTIAKEQIDALPLNGRNPVTLVNLLSGVAANTNANTSIAGNRTSFTNMTLDGINVQDGFIRSNATTFTPNRLTQSMVGEFTISTQNQNAASGFGSVQVSFVTPSGGNDINGEIYWAHRNDALAATDFFTNLSGNEQPNLIRNQFGFAVSGPIVKDKLFFYGNYEGYRERTGSTQLTTVLGPDARQGIFRYNDAATGEERTVNLLDISNGVTGRNLGLDPTTQALLALTPSAFNDLSTGDGVNTGGFRFNALNNEDRDQFGFRLDYNLNDSHAFEGVYRHNEITNDRPDFAINVGESSEVNSQTDGPLDFISTAWKWTVSPNFLNEVRFGANLTAVDFNVFIDRPSGSKVTFDSVTDPISTSEKQGRETDTWVLADNASWQWENHSFRFGFQSQFVRTTPFLDSNVFTNFTLDVDDTPFELNSSAFPGAIGSGDLARANAILADVAGIIGQIDRDFNITSRDSGFVNTGDVKNWEFDIYSFYFGDSWRIHPRVVLNAGLRWEYYTPLREADDLITQPVIRNGDPFDAVLDPDNVTDFVNGDLFEKDLNNFAPSIGLAWDLFGDGKTALRAGYSIAYVNDSYITAPRNAINQFGVTGNVQIENVGQPIVDGLPVPGAPEFKLPLTWPEITDPNSPNFADALPAAFVVDPDLQVPYSQSWNLSIQRELGWDTALEIRYSGNRGTKLFRAFDLNQVEIRNNGFLEDFRRAQQNLELSRAFDGTSFAGFRPEVNGSQQLPVFDNLGGGGFLGAGAVITRIEQGRVGSLVDLYNQNALCGGVACVANPAVFVADVLTNGSDSIYHGVQTEVRRRFSNGLLFNLNYTFSKNIENFSGSQANFEPVLDLANPSYDRGRALADINHVFNAHFIYDLPFGQGRRFDLGNGLLDKLAGGWQVTSIFSWQSGDPFSLLSNRGTVNRDGRSLGRNRASTDLDNSGVRELLGFGSDASGPFFLNPEFRDQFFHPDAGELGSLGRFAFNGPSFFNWDFAVSKRTQLHEELALQFSAEFFNFTNHVNFGVGNAAQSSTRLNIDNAAFGRVFNTNSFQRIIQFSLKLVF